MQLNIFFLIFTIIWLTFFYLLSKKIFGRSRVQFKHFLLLFFLYQQSRSSLANRISNVQCLSKKFNFIPFHRRHSIRLKVVKLDVKEIHSWFCVEMCLNFKLLLVPPRVAQCWMYLLLCLNWRQLVVDGDGKPSNVGFVVLFHAHSCFKAGEKNQKKGRKKNEKRERTEENLIQHHASCNFLIWRLLTFRLLIQITSRQSTWFTIWSATWSRKCTLTINTWHHHRCQ